MQMVNILYIMNTKLTICKETGKIANEYCKDVEEKTYLVKPQKENTNLWSTNAGDKYNIPTETCDVHKAPEQVEMINVVGKTLDEAKKAIEKIRKLLDKKSKCEGWKFVYLSFSKDRDNVDALNLGSYYYEQDCEKFEKLLRTGEKIIEEKEFNRFYFTITFSNETIKDF